MGEVRIETNEQCGDALAPPAGSVERWCFDFVSTTSLAAKLTPPPPPDPCADSSFEKEAPERRVLAPGRPAELVVVERSPSVPRGSALAESAQRARLLHTFVHHELQAAELFAWAVLAFPRAPLEFRRGLVRLCLEELAHLHLYRDHLLRLGGEFGDHPVRDWFWERVPLCTNPASFVALQGLGLEGANLEHSARFAAQFRAVGDETGAHILERVERDETAHVAFAVHWFERFTGQPLSYDVWRAALPKPLTPALMQGRPLNRAARMRAGMDERFLEQLVAEPPTALRRNT